MAKSITGVVSSAKADKTIVVTVRERKTHPLYRKQYTTTKKFMAHDEDNVAQTGDKVIIVESRPLSRRKSFVLQEIVETAEVQHVETDSAARPDSKTKAKMGNVNESESVGGSEQ